MGAQTGSRSFQSGSSWQGWSEGKDADGTLQGWGASHGMAMQRKLRLACLPVRPASNSVLLSHVVLLAQKSPKRVMEMTP